MAVMTGNSDHSPKAAHSVKCAVMTWIVLCAGLLILSACGTTPSKQKKSSIPVQARQNCIPGSQQKANAAEAGQAADAKGEAGKKAPAMNNCLPKGVIEIVENFGVDPEVKVEFSQSLTLLEQENYPEAIRLLKAVTGKTSKFTAPFINLGIAYARTGEMELAETALKKAIEINSFHPVAINELGLVYRKTGRYAEARELYQTLLAAYPDFLPARKNLGVLCDIYVQDLDCALEQYEEYLKGIPEDEKVKIWVADVKSRM